jgi:Tfp pilus assembly protein PilX
MINKKPNLDRPFIQFLLRAQQVAQQDPRSEKGYAMLIVSIITISMFSLLAAYMTMANLSKSSTDAYIDGTNTFYAAESGLNKRAEQLRQKFIGYAAPANKTGTANPANISTCFSLSLTTTNTADNDFECRNYGFNYNNNIAQVTASGGATVISEQDNGRNKIRYTAYTFVAPKQDYIATPPTRSVIPSGQLYAGLNNLEYLYTVYSTAAKPDPSNATNPVQQSDGKTVLQMNFRSRIVPLFQFAVFYDGDLEMYSSSNMTISGRVHTNANLYVFPYNEDPNISTTFLSPVTAVGRIYNRVDTIAPRFGSRTRVLAAGGTCTSSTCFPAYDATNQNPIDVAPYGSNVKDGSDTALVRLDTPPPGFLRKRNYFEGKTTSNAGEYYAKADMRLEMVPDRDVTSTGVTPWIRNTAIIPFNFNSVTSDKGAANTCTTTLPGTDALASGRPAIAGNPAANYIDSERNNPASGALLTNLHCNVFTKGQLQSLRQPVLVLKNPTPALQTAEDTALGKPAVPTTGLPTLSITANTPATKAKILRALQVALASMASPVTLDMLDLPFNNAAYTTTGTQGNLFLSEFTRMLNTIPTSILPSADVINLTTGARTPKGIANIQDAWFLPAPVQRIETNSNPAATVNVRSSGFYDGRERRWITMLQTNIASLSVWNRDSLYVEASDNVTDTLRRLPYVTTSALRDAAFNSGAGANFTDGLAFDRAATIPTTTTAKGLQSLGLGSLDNTEGGLVFHATVSDDLNGDGVMDANDVSLDTANPIKKRDAVGALVGTDNRPVTPTNPEVIIDYPRKYRGGNNYQSPFGFAFNGGDSLPAPLTLVTDQATYIQGNFNNNRALQPNTPAAIAGNPPSPNRLPASIVGDTITILSNQCVSGSSTSATTPRPNDLLVPAGQISCGIPNSTTRPGSANLPGGSYYPVTGPVAVNAAFLSNTDQSFGNLGTGRGFGTATPRNSGGLNNYMRMVEDWGATQYFNYSGSFVSLGTPLEYSGQYFLGGTYYNIPVRNYNFDTAFNNFTSLPPLPPRAIYLQQDVFKRTYN